MNNYLNKLIMYHEIHKMHRDGYSINSIADYLVINWRTVKSYLSMNEQEYDSFLSQSKKNKELECYESFVKVKLESFQSTSAAQMHDWLKEHYTDFPVISAKTVYNFVMWVRQKYNLPKVKNQREYCIVEDKPWGHQAQVDFGEYSMRTSQGQRKKVYFFCFVLSRSRYKYVYFSDTPFTTALACHGHDKAFEYIKGIPHEIVYDQDKVFLRDENYGDLLLTQGFKNYVSERGFHLYFCRKADPESKGKIENMVKYVKQNFLYNRPFVSIEQLNNEALAWLSRTANSMPHARTLEAPKVLWEKEFESLNPFDGKIGLLEPKNTFTVRKDNSILYKGSLYSLPQGTWKNNQTKVCIELINDEIRISSVNGLEICSHKKSTLKGKTIVNNNHRRDNSESINTLIQQTKTLFVDQQKATQYLDTLHKKQSRYIRDQLKVIQKCFDTYPVEVVNQTLETCLFHHIYSASQFEAVALSKQSKSNVKIDVKIIKTLPNCDIKATDLQPNKSDIDIYQQIMTN